MYKPEVEVEVEKEPSAHIPEPWVPVSVPVIAKPSIRQSSWVRSEPSRYGFPSKVLYVSV